MAAPFSGWADGLLQAADGAIGGCVHGFACVFRRDENAVTIDPNDAVALRLPHEMLRTILHGLTNVPPRWVSEYMKTHHGPAQCNLTSEVDRTGDLTYRAQLAALGIADGVNLIATDLDDFGFMVSLGVPATFELDNERRADLKRAATHVLSGFRLRRRLGISRSSAAGAEAAPLASAEPDAVLSPDGELVHAEGEAKLAAARDALRKATREIEQVRAGRWAAPRDALDRWKGLVAARWSLVERFEESGRRYIIARENQPSPRPAGLAGLTSTQRCVVAYVARGCTTKETAYILGISDSTVRVHLVHAVRQCGVKNRRELIELWETIAQPPPALERSKN